jgi:hypothetical protein
MTSLKVYTGFLLMESNEAMFVSQAAIGPRVSEVIEVENE